MSKYKFSRDFLSDTLHQRGQIRKTIRYVTLSSPYSHFLYKLLIDSL